jgi:hypothetical protein
MQYTSISPFLPYVSDEQQFYRMREHSLGLPTNRQSQVEMDVDSTNILTDITNMQQRAPTAINQKSRATEKAKEKKLIVHYTHEKRFDSLKREMHQIFHDVFKNSPVADVKSIVGTRNRRDARNDLIRKRPQRALLKNEQRKSKRLFRQHPFDLTSIVERKRYRTRPHPQAREPTDLSTTDGPMNTPIQRT